MKFFDVFFKLLLAYPVLPCTYTQIYTMAISYGDLNFYLQHYGTLKHWYTIFSTTLGIHNLRSSLWPSILIQSPSHCDKFKMSNSKSRLSPFNHTCHAKESRSYRNLFGSDCWIILIILFWNRFITELIVSKFCTNLKKFCKEHLDKKMTWLSFSVFMNAVIFCVVSIKTFHIITPMQFLHSEAICYL